MTIKNCISNFITCRVSVLTAALLVSIFALIAAYTAQFAYELEPCILCLYQRLPFAIVIVIALIGLTIKSFRTGAIALCALAFIGNAGIAFYHVGVEQQWWASIFEACQVPDSFLNPQTTESLLNQLLKTPSVPCSQIAWKDPVFGASMAVYNVLLCLGMFLLCSFNFFKQQIP